MKSKKLIQFMILLLTFITVFSVSSSALTWDGSSAGGSTNAVNGSSKGYVIRSTYDSACVVGYRFSVVNQSGGMKVNKVIDVYRNTVNGDNAYNTSAKFTNKYNKKQLIAHKNDVMTTTYNKVNCYRESSMNFLVALPNPDGVKSWQAYENNINKVLQKIGVGSTANMVFGDKVIIEPLFDVCLAGEYQALTVSEIAWCGRSVLGYGSNGGYSNGTSSTWGFIANYTNRIWPNKLYTPDGQGLWPAASTISYRNTFENLLTRGYGAGIAYQEKNNKELTICYDAYGSNVKMTDSSKGYWLSSYHRICSSESSKTIAGTSNVYYHTLRYNNQIGGSGLRDFSSFGLSAPTGYKFSYWKNGEKYFYENVTTYRPTDFTNDINNGSTYIWLTAKFSPIIYYVKYNGNGATEGTTKNSWHTYDISRNLTPNAYYRDGYIFTGWNTKADGTGISYQDQQSVKNLTAKDGATINLYAQWKSTGYTIKFNGNGNTGGSTSSMSMPFNQYKQLNTNGFTKSCYYFTGWNTRSDGLGTNYSDRQYVSNLASKNGEIVTLYAQWRPIMYIVKFDGNGNTGGSTSSIAVNYNQMKNLTVNGFTKTGYEFRGWNTKSDGSGTSYSDRQIIKNLTTVNNKIITMYAQWEPITYTVKFVGNGQTEGTTQSMTLTYDKLQELNKNGYKKTGSAFINWNTKPDGSGTKFEDKQSVKNLTTIKGQVIFLYAQWKPMTYTIKFDGNGNTGGSTAPMVMKYNMSKLLNINGFTKTGYRFDEWNTKADGTGTVFENQQRIKNLTLVDGKVITLYAQWKPAQLLSLEAIRPNAPYRKGTDVVTSFNIVNKGEENCIPSDNIKVEFNVYKNKGLYKTVTLNNVIVPAHEKNLLYFKWSVPDNAENIFITGQIYKNGESLYYVRSDFYSICNYDHYETPDTQYEINGPENFIKPSKPTDKTGTATWTEWKYSSGKFTKVSMGLGYSLYNQPKIKPDAKANSSFSNNIWTTKSGYGIELSYYTGVRAINGYAMPDTSAYTLSQYAVAEFPEFNYQYKPDCCRTLEQNSGKWIFRENADYGKVHFTPLWYPDGEYSINIVESDMWTPAGMISQNKNTTHIIIKGSAYDDWYIQ